MAKTSIPIIKELNRVLFKSNGKTEEFVRVVRCKDCENCYPIRLRNGEVYFYKCDFHDTEIEPDAFCSYGARKEN